ncbi:hypothetical protein FB451DRAFT_1411881 [Mycena latifolia]|nr:hypothetical protein FB451DRAFT_1411881 [Mycena latifolia]
MPSALRWAWNPELSSTSTSVNYPVFFRFSAHDGYPLTREYCLDATSLPIPAAHTPGVPHSSPGGFSLCTDTPDGKSLRVLVLKLLVKQLRDGPVSARAELAAQDPRFVMVAVKHPADDWENAARTGEDFWVRAEALVEERRAGRTTIELEREIFETTALLYPSTIPTLLRVARRILVWVEPMLYRVVRVNATPPYSAMAQAVLRARKTKPRSFFNKAVRYLVLDFPAAWTLDEAREVLKLCTDLIGFAPIAYFANPTMLPILAEMHVQRLSVCLRDLFGGYSFDGDKDIDFTHPVFTSITHLDVFDSVGERICAHLPSLPALTHLCLSEVVPWDMVRRLLVECPGLEVLLDLFPAIRQDVGRAWAQSIPFHDIRFVVGVYTDYVDEWEQCAQGLPKFWLLADDFVAQKRRGEMNAQCYWLHT